MLLNRLQPLVENTRSRWVLGIAVLGLLLGASVSLLFFRASSDVAADDPVAERAAAAEVKYVAQFTDGAHAFALLWRGDELWYVRSPAEGVLSLVRYRASVGTTVEWMVPVKSTQTFHTYLAADSSGKLWIAANYVVAAFDPRDETFVVAMTLDRHVSDVETDGSGATWLNGLAVGPDGHPVLTRNGVFAVYEARPAGLVVAEQLDEAPAGLKTFNGQTVPYRLQADSSVLLGGRSPGAVVPFHDRGSGGCRFEQKDGSLTVRANSGAVLRTGLAVPPSAPVGMSPDGSHAALYLPLQGSIVEFNCVDGIVSEHPLEVVSQLPDGLAPEDDSSANPGRPPAEMPDVVEALAVSPDGTIAAALASNRIAIIQAHP